MGSTSRCSTSSRNTCCCFILYTRYKILIILLVRWTTQVPLLASDAASQLDVPGHDRNPLGVDRAQVGVLKEPHQVRLSGLLESFDGRALETQIGLVVLGNLFHQTLEGELVDEEVLGLLVVADLSESHSTGAVAVGFLGPSSSRGGSAGFASFETLAWGLASYRLAGVFFGASHGLSGVEYGFLG